MKKTVDKEAQAAIDWLGSQPNVTSVILGKRPTRTRHRHAPGFTKVIGTDASGVRLLTYGPGVAYEIFVNAPPTTHRDKWVAQLAGGDIIGKEKKADKPKPPSLTPVQNFSSEVPTPTPFDDNAGQIYDVTPDLAAKWLERNTRNRALRDDTVQKYAADMKAGKWKVTGDAISFDTNGCVVNGQHRLWAVFSSGITVRMLAVFDLDPDVVKVLDDHLKRTTVDVIHIDKPGLKVSTKHTSAARTMMFNLTRTDKHSSSNKISRQEQMEFLERHYPALNFAVSDCFHSRYVKLMTHSSIIAFVARASYTRDKLRIQSFCKVLTTGMPENAADKAAVIFRNWLIRLDTQKTRATPEVIYRKGERALDAFLKNEPIETLYEAREELFPLPEEAPLSKEVKAKISRVKKPAYPASNLTSLDSKINKLYKELREQ